MRTQSIYYYSTLSDVVSDIEGYVRKGQVIARPHLPAVHSAQSVISESHWLQQQAP